MTSINNYIAIKSKKSKTTLNFDTSTIKSNYVKQKLSLININRNEFRQFLQFYKNNPTNRLISRAHYNPTIFGIKIIKNHPIRKHFPTQISIPQNHIPVTNYYELLAKGIIPSGIQAGAGPETSSIASCSQESDTSYHTAEQNFTLHQTPICQICDDNKHTQFYSSSDINIDTPITAEQVAEHFASSSWFEKIFQTLMAIKNLTIRTLINLIKGQEEDKIEGQSAKPYNIKMCDECAIAVFSMITSPDKMQEKEKQIMEKGLSKIRLQKEKLETKAAIDKIQLESTQQQLFKNFSFNNDINRTTLIHKQQETSLNEAKIMNLDLQNTKLGTELNSFADKQSAEIGMIDAQTSKIEKETQQIAAQTKELEITYAEKLVKSAVETLKYEREYAKLKEEINISDIYGYVVIKTTGQQIGPDHEKYVAQIVNTYFDNKKFFNYQLIAWTQKIIMAMYIRDNKYALSSYINFTTKKTKQMPDINELDESIPTYNIVKNINKVNQTRALIGKKSKFFGLVNKTNEVKKY